MAAALTFLVKLTGGMIQNLLMIALDADGNGEISDTEIIILPLPSENWIRTRTANSHQMNCDLALLPTGMQRWQ